VDRRTFNKLFAGAVTAAGMQSSSAEMDSLAAHQVQDRPGTTAAPRRHSSGKDAWELVILDAAPPHMTETAGDAAADIDNDGKTELVVCGNGALL
jgi:hypothetical protein